MAGPPPWVCATASARGSSHRASDAPNQDAVASFETDDGVAVAVADGHGGERYVRSATGSSIAVDVARQMSAELLRSNGDLARASREMPTRLVAEWRRRVDAHLTQHPLEPADAERVGSDPRVAYGATLLLVVCRRDQAVALQLGDGDVAVAWQDGAVTSPVPPEPRNVGGQTTSLCLRDAERSFRIAELRRENTIPAAILAATDGYGNSFEHDDWAPAVLRDLLAQRRNGALDTIFAALPEWASESAKVGGDDTTIALVFRSDTGTAPVAGVADGGIAAAAGPPAHGRRPRWIEVGILGVVALVFGAVLGYLLSGGDGSDASTATTQSLTVPATAASQTSASTSAPIRPPVTTAATTAPSTAPSTSPSTVPATSPPTAAPATLPPASEPPVPRASVVLAAGPWRLEVDPFADPVAVASITPAEGATPIRQILTTGGRWEAVESGLQFTPAEGSPAQAWPVEAPTRMAGLAFTGDRVVAVAVTTTDAGDVLTVGVFDGASGRQLAISAQVPTGND